MCTLAAVMWADFWMALAIASGLTILVLALRVASPRGLRGVKGDLPTQSWSEVAYAVSLTGSLVVGWGLLGDPWLAFVPIAFMAWGDSAAGVLRRSIRENQRMRELPSLAMLTVCLIAAALFQPYWIAAIGAVVAASAERIRPVRHALWDDNWFVVLTSLTVMAALARADTSLL